MAEVRIDWLMDSSDCETCGGGYAEGARVWVDGMLTLELLPVATCFGGESWDQTEVFREVLKVFGYTLVSTYGNGDS